MPNDLQSIRDYAASLQGDERKSFIDKFNSIKNDDSKIGILAGRISKLSGDTSPQGESGDDWMSKSFPKTARNNLNKLYQGGANSPANVEAQKQLEIAKSGRIDMRKDTSNINPVEGAKDALSVVSNPVGTVSKMITGKTLADNIGGEEKDTSKMSIPDMLTHNAMKALGEATEQTANFALGGGIGE